MEGLSFLLVKVVGLRSFDTLLPIGEVWGRGAGVLSKSGNG